MRQLWVPFLLILAGVLVALAIAEGLIRLLGAAPAVIRLAPRALDSAYQLSENRILGYELKPGFRSTKQDCHNSFAYINSWGQRDRERTISKAPGSRRILVVGDSVVAGHGLCSMEDTVPAQLESALGGSGYEVLNFGVGGYCTRGEVELLKTKGLAFEPDLVVLMFVANDYVDRNGQVLEQLRTPRPWPIEELFVRSNLFRLAALSIDVMGFRKEFGLINAHSGAVGDNNVESGLAELSALRAAHGFDVAVALWPYFDDMGIGEPDVEGIVTNDPEVRIEHLARAHGIETFRLSPFFQLDFKRRLKEVGRKRRLSPRWLYTTGDGTHPSKLGAQIAADGLKELVMAHGRGL